MDAVCGETKSVLSDVTAFTVYGALDVTTYPKLSAKHRLMSDVFGDYNKNILPSENKTAPVNVSVYVHLFDLIDLDESTETLEVIYWIWQDWRDVRLQWDPTKYSNVTTLLVLASSIWTPDLMPYNSVEEFHTYQDVLAKVSSDGNITWLPPVRVRSKCTMDLSRYPRDEHNCTVTFGSWMYLSSHINFTTADVSSGFDSDEKHWQVISTEGKSYEKKYPCCPEMFSLISVTIRLRRNSLFITRIVIIPGVLLAMLVPFQMLLPPESNERMTLGSVLVVALMVIDLKLQDILPEQHITSPPIQIFVLLAQVWNLLSILLSILVLNLSHRGVRQGQVPPFIKMIFLDVLKRLVFVADSKQKLHGLDNPITSVPFTAERPASPSRSSGDDPDTGKHIQTLLKIEDSLSKMVEYLNSTRAKHVNKADMKKVTSEWRELALVLDRLFFIGSLVTFFLCCVTLLT